MGSDDDGGLGLNASLRFTTADAGDYVVELAGVGSLTGTYLFQLTAVEVQSAPDLYAGGPENDVFTGGPGDDELSGNGGDDTLYGGAGNDRLFGGDGSDRLFGEDGNDFLDGGAGADYLDGGLGDDTYVYDGLDQLVEAAGAGNDTVLSSVNYMLGANLENLTLTGTAYQAAGNGLHNVLIGNSANNRLYGGGGADRMIGGVGDDAYQVDDIGDVVIEAAGEGLDSVQSEITFTLPDHVENLTLVRTLQPHGTYVDQGIEGYGNALDNRIIGNLANNIIGGGAGNDTLTGWGGADRFLFNSALDALTNVDHITDFSADDSIVLDRTVFTAISGAGALDTSAFVVGSAAADADDRIVYDQASGNIYYDPDGNGAAAQVLFARVAPGTVLTAANFAAIDGGTPANYAPIGYRGSEADNYWVGGLGNDRAFGNEGNDTLIGGGGDDTLSGDIGNDVVDGGDGDDALYGGLGDDTLAGGEGNDRLIGSNGHDTLYGGDGQDILRGGRANDQLHGGVGDDNLDGGLNSDVLYGEAGNDTLVGGNGHDVLYGGDGNDLLKGGRGTDVLEGGAGRDIMFGGLEADTFAFRDGDFAGLTPSTSDRIEDFSQALGDKIDLSLVDANSLAAGLQGFQFIGTGGFSNVAGELRYEQVNGDTVIYGDTNGDAMADFTISLTGSHSLNSGAFVI